MENNREDYGKEIIAKAATKGRFLDFRDNLVPAVPDQYAFMHGQNYRDYGIQIFVTNYTTNRNGEKTGSSSAFAHVGPDLIARIHEVCRKNIGVQRNPVEDYFVGIAFKMDLFIQSWHAVLKSVKGIFADLVGGKPVTEANKDCAKGALNAIKVLLGKDENGGPSAPGIDPEKWTDFDYRHEHVNTHRLGNDGFCPVSCLHIWRSGLDRNGNKQGLPWAVNIQRFESKPVTDSKGLTTYDSKSVRNKSEAWIQITDDQMFQCTYRVEHYVSVWENAIAIPYIRAAVKEAAMEAAVRKAGRQQGGQNHVA